MTVKTFDLVSATRQCLPLIGEDTVVVSVMNGVEWVEQLTDLLTSGVIAAGVATFPSNIERPGVIDHKGRESTITLGLPGNKPASPKLVQFHKALRDAGVDAQLRDDIDTLLWTKFIMWSAGAGVQCVSRQPVGSMQGNSELKSTFLAAQSEALAVARAGGVNVPVEVMERMLDTVENMPPESKVSMLLDLESGKRLELSASSGTVVRLGRRHGVETPVSQAIFAALQPFEHGV